MPDSEDTTATMDGDPCPLDDAALLRLIADMRADQTKRWEADERARGYVSGWQAGYREGLASR